MSTELDRGAFGLWPSEQVLWHGHAVQGVPLDRRLRIAAFAFVLLGVIAALFAGLLHVAELPGTRDLVSLGALLLAMAVASILLPHWLSDGLEYVVTDRRVFTRRGRHMRQMERAAITFGRLRWSAAMPHVGDLELVIAVPFGPLSRKQKLVLRAVRDPESVFAIIRGRTPRPGADDRELPLVERLDPGEQVVWGGRPVGRAIGWRELATAAIGVLASVLAFAYAHAVFLVLADLERVGLPVRSWTWVLFFLPVTLSFLSILGVGAWLIWWGLFRARILAGETDYVLTDRRLLIRRGPVEFSVERRRIVDAALTPAGDGRHNVFLMLDAPRGRALAIGAALSRVAPPRDDVAPVLYDVGDAEGLVRLMFAEEARATPE
ncbi:MAG: hypothetical protein GXP55_19900 [Deltaproteobacteria bacterium]|nr:hypothetical protein [Deltaproteobacteria bacterium]